MSEISTSTEMRKRTLLIGSVALNVLLGVLWLSGRGDRPFEPVSGPPEAQLGNGEVRTNVVVRQQFFSWNELESEDYATYIANLRDIHCPEETIRDIIIADVDELFARRRSTEILPTTQQWWQSEPDPVLREMAYRQRQSLEAERNKLLTELLGPDWNVPTTPIPTVAIKVPLDGPLLSTLPTETQEAIQAVSGRMQQQFERILETGGGETPDPAAIAALQRQLRNELTPLLTPSQLEEFMFRFSPAAHRLRAELTSVALFNPSPVEMKALFQSAEDIELQRMSLEGEGPGVEARRQALAREREIAFRNALGPARYREYERLQDPAYQGAVAAAQAAGITNAADLFYAIDRVGAQEEARIRSDSSLTPLEQEIALRKLELEQLQAAGAVLGEPEPAQAPLPAMPQQTYSFQKGDTIADVSMRTGVPVALILRANPNLEAENIPPGTEIIIPDKTAPLQ